MNGHLGRRGGVGHRGTLTVTMLNVLRADFEAWLRSRNLLLVQVPGDPAGTYIVVPVDLPPETLEQDG